jgi:hypothetical protein
MLDLPVAIEQHDGRARRRIGLERADEVLASLRDPPRTLEPGTHEIEHVAVTLGELTLATAQPSDNGVAAAKTLRRNGSFAPYSPHTRAPK